MDVILKVYAKHYQLSYDGTCRSKLATLSGRMWLLLCPLSRATRMMMMTDPVWAVSVQHDVIFGSS